MLTVSKAVSHIEYVKKELFLLDLIALTLLWPRFLSYRNQSIDLHSKSKDWFIHDRDLRHKRVKSSIFFLAKSSLLFGRAHQDLNRTNLCHQQISYRV